MSLGVLTLLALVAANPVLKSADKPVKWSKGWSAVEGEAGEVRYEATVEVPGGAGLGVSVGRVAAQWELRAGQITLGRGDGAPPTPAWFKLPPEAVGPEGAVRLSLVTHRAGGDGGIGRIQGGPFRLGRFSVVKERTKRLMARNVSKSLPILLLIGALLALGLYHLLLVGRRQEFGVYLSVGLMALAFAAHAAVVHGWGTFLPLGFGYAARASLEAALALVSSALVLSVLRRLLEREAGRVGRSLQIALVTGAALSMLPGGLGLAVAGSPLQTVLGLAAVAWAVTLLAGGSWAHRNGPSILVGAGALIAASAYDVVAQPDLPAAYAGLLAFVLSMAVALGRHFRRTLVELDVRNAQLSRFNEAANRFVPAELLQLIGRDSVVDVERGDQRQLELTVMFSDVRGFTALSEARTPGQTMELINRYLRFIEGHVHDFEGAIGSFLGDGVMALYYGGADKAVQSALAQLEALKEFNAEQRARGDTPIQVGIGLNTGKLMLGTVGGQDRLDCSVIGDAVNLAARIEGLTKRYGATVLLSQATYDELADTSTLRMRSVDRVVVKGKSEPMSLYEVLDGLPREARQARVAALDDWREARRLYLAREFDAAGARFRSLAEDGDVAAALYGERCVHLAEAGRGPDWDGSFEWTVK